MRRRLLGDLFGWLFFALFGTAFVIIGAAVGLLLTSETRGMSRAQGRVVDYAVEDGAYRAIVEFATADGEPITFVDSTSASAPIYKMEQTVEVRYWPDGPRRTARVTVDLIASGLWLLPTMFIGIGGVFAAIGWGGLFNGLRRRPEVT
jgi:hypothetical protein